jgi:MoCo/4Fe-4S cofactor protein with predicted Tat translocation signal
MDNNYWKSFAELYDHPEIRQFRDKEFVEGETSAPQVEEMSGMNRRQFVALMGASAALAATGCSNYRDEGKIVPYNKKSEEDTPGVPLFYGTTIVS